jgi:chaperonin GroEL
VISDEVGLKLENVELKHFGSAKKVVITQDDTIILSGGGEKEAIEERCEMIRTELKKSDTEYNSDKLRERLAKLAGGVALLRVGGASDVEVGEKKDRITYPMAYIHDGSRHARFCDNFLLRTYSTRCSFPRAPHSVGKFPK